MTLFTRTHSSVAIAAALGLLSAGMNKATAGEGNAPELVLNENVRLTAQLPVGRVSVVTGDGAQRRFEWAGCSLNANMRPRTTRWFGSLGIYDPGFGPDEVLVGSQCADILRTAAEEAQIHFGDEESAAGWLRRYAQVGPTVWSSDGLIVQWFARPQRKQLHVRVWQICVMNRYPTLLQGANDALLTLEPISGTRSTRLPCTRVDGSVISETLTAWKRHWEEQEQLEASPQRAR